MSTPLLTFNAKSVSADKLEKTLVGRDKIVNEISKDLKKKIQSGATHQTLIIAPRGSGKTHMTKLIYSRLKADAKLRNKYRIAYMIEDEAGIASFIHLLLQILLAIQRHGEPNSEHIQDDITFISQLSTKEQLPALKKLLLDYLQGKILIVLLENLAKLFKAMDDYGAALRDFMHEHNCISLISTSQSLSNELKNSKYPFYQFFKTYHLEQLSFNEAFTLIKALASIEEDPAIKNDLEAEFENNPEVEDKIKAIYDLTYGNHRLLVHFYSFLKADLKAELSVAFTKQMNDLKSYYEQFVNSLAAQQQRVIQILSLSRNPITGKDIAQRAFLSQNIVSKKLSELHKLGYVDKHKSGKEVFYEIKEPLMRICFEINENPDGIAKLFIDFLKEIYTSERLETEYFKFKLSTYNQDCPAPKNYLREARMLVNAMTTEQLESVKDFEKSYNKLQNKSHNKIYSKKFLQIKQNYTFLINKAIECYVERKYEKSIIFCEKSKNILPFHPIHNHILGLVYSNLGDYNSAIKCYKDLISHNPKDLDAHYNLGNSYSNIKNFKLAIKSYQNAIKLNSFDESAYYNLGVTYTDIGKYKSAIKYYKKAIEINPDYLLAHHNLGFTYLNMKNFKLAIKTYKSAIEIDPDNYDSHFGLGNAYIDAKNYKLAIKAYRIAIRINCNDHKSHCNLGNSYSDIGNFKLAIKSYKRAIDLNQNDFIAYNNLGMTYFDIQDYNSALKSYNHAIRINPEYHVAHDNLGDFYLYTEDYELAINSYKMAITCNKNALLLEINWLTTLPLIYHKKLKSDQMLSFKNFLHNTYKNESTAILPLKILDTGIKYLVEGDKRAVFRLSKEERKVFQERILDKIKE